MHANAVDKPWTWIFQDPVDLPHNWSYRRKWVVTGFSCFVCFLVGINALAISSATENLIEEFHISDEKFPNSYWVISAWAGAGIISPVFGLPTMEEFGIRKCYLIFLALFAIFQIGPALANNYATVIATRFFAGFFGNIVNNAVANVIEDLWEGDSNSWPVVLFCWVYLMGFALGPVFACLVMVSLDWRWIFWISLIVYAGAFVLAFFIIKETRLHVINKKRRRSGMTILSPTVSNVDSQIESGLEADNKSVSTTSNSSILKLLYEGTIRPVQLFTTEPVCFVFVVWSALAVGQIFMASQSVGQIFGTNYGWSIPESSWIQASLAIGHTIGVIPCAIQVFIYHRSGQSNKIHPGRRIPEKRFMLSIPCSFVFFCGGLFIYGWTSTPNFHWAAPASGLMFAGIGIMTIVYGAVAYLQDAYAAYAGSAIAAMAAMENVMSAFLPLATYSMYNTLGYQWASSVLGFFALAISIAATFLYFYAPILRERSPFMQSLDRD